MNDETLVALRNLARARSLASGALNEENDAYARYEAAKRDREACDRAHRRAQNDLEDALIADRGLLAEALLNAEIPFGPGGSAEDVDLRRIGTEHLHEFRVVDDRIVCDCGFSAGRDGTFQNGVEISIAPSFTELIPDQTTDEYRMVEKARSMTCQVGWPERDCRKPSGHNGQHTWEVTAEELAEAEEARSAAATAALVNEAIGRANTAGTFLAAGDPLTDGHHPFEPNNEGRCCHMVSAVHFGNGRSEITICGKDPNAPVHLLYAGDGNTRVDYTPTPKGTD